MKVLNFIQCRQKASRCIRMACWSVEYVSFFKMIFYPKCVQLRVHMFVSNCSATTGIESVLRMFLARCFSTGTSVAAMLTNSSLRIHGFQVVSLTVPWEISRIDILGISCELAHMWMSQNLTNHADDWSTLVRVMAWCRQATSHYLSHVDQVIWCH